MDGSSLYAQANASLTLPGLTSYAEPNSGNLRHAPGIGGRQRVVAACADIDRRHGWPSPRPGLRPLSGGDVGLPSGGPVSGSVAVESEGAGSTITCLALQASTAVRSRSPPRGPSPGSRPRDELGGGGGDAGRHRDTGHRSVGQASPTAASTATGGTYTFAGLTDIDGSSLLRAGKCEPDHTGREQLYRPEQGNLDRAPGIGVGERVVTARHDIDRRHGRPHHDRQALSGGYVDCQS